MSYDELAGSPRESLNEHYGSIAERKFLIPFTDRLTFAQAIVGTAYPNFPQARVTSVDLQPWHDELIPSGTIVDPALQSAGYGTQPCLVTVKYGPDFTQKTWPSDFPKPTTIRSGTELRYRIGGSVLYQVLPDGALAWESAGTDSGSGYTDFVDSPATRMLIPVREIELQWDFVDDPPIETLDAFMGTVNSTTFIGSPAETLLFENYFIEDSFRAAPVNPHTNRVIVNLRQRKINGASPGEFYGWNHEYRADIDAWDRVFLSNGNARYQGVSMNNMFA